MSLQNESNKFCEKLPAKHLQNLISRNLNRLWINHQEMKILNSLY